LIHVMSEMTCMLVDLDAPHLVVDRQSVRQWEAAELQQSGGPNVAFGEPVAGDGASQSRRLLNALLER
jgi:hypothetical protein